MDKLALKNELIRLQKEMVAEFQQKLTALHSVVDLDETDTHDPEDFSHQTEAMEEQQLFAVQMDKAQQKLDLIENLDTDSKSIVENGALVVTDRRNFVIGCSTLPFDFEGREWMGISPGAPIYEAIEGKKEGESFSFGGVDYSIEKIY